MELNIMTYNELQDLRDYLINDFFYYLSVIEDEYELDIIVDDINKEIKEVEEYMELRKN